MTPSTKHVRPIDPDEELPVKDTGEFTYGDSDEDIAADNYRRATFAAVGIQAYAKATRAAGASDVLEVLGDFLGDIRHLLDCLAAGAPAESDSDGMVAADFDFDALVSRSEFHYTAEIQGET